MAGIMDQLKMTNDVTDLLTFNEREFKALLGLSPAAFVKLLEPFEQSQKAIKAQGEAQRRRPRQRKAGGGRKATLRTSASKLGFILYFLKGYDTLDNVGDRVGLHRSNVTRNQQALLDVLLGALAQLGVLPKRAFATPDELTTAFAGIEELVIDATERPILRPQEASDQKKVIAAKSIKTP